MNVFGPNGCTFSINVSNRSMMINLMILIVELFFLNGKHQILYFVRDEMDFAKKWLLCTCTKRIYIEHVLREFILSTFCLN